MGLIIPYILLLSLCLTGALVTDQGLGQSLPVSTSDQAPVIGFDCNQTEPEILTISTLEVGSCPEINSLKPAVSSQYGQILQSHIYDHVQVRTCQITKSTSYFKCARGWANYNVYPPSIGVIKHVTKNVCDKIHTSGIYKYSENKEPWQDMTPNTTYHHAVNEIGWTDHLGYCQGGTVYIANKEHTDTVVQASYTISVRESWAKVDLETGTINIENLLSCAYNKGYCTDAKTGTHIWTPRDTQCKKGEYRTLYEGQVNVTTSPGDSTALLSINSPPFLFTSEMGLPTYVCGLNLIMTEFPGVFYAAQKNGVYQGKFLPPDTNDIEFITYLNSKITFMYHNLINSARDMYLASIHRTCEVERQMLRNRIEIIRLNSQSGGLSTLLKEGMFARANGEVMHLVKCEPVPVQLRNTQTCHESLPITYKGQNMFLLPNTHILSPYSPEIPCTPITPLTYKIGGKWWSYTGSYQMGAEPNVLKPHTKDDLVFEKIKSFSKGGMYASEQIEAVQKLLVFPSLREAISTDITAGLTKYYGKGKTLDVTSIMSEADYENIATRNIKKFWGYFSAIGNVISGFIGVYFVYRVIKGALNCLIDGKSLYSAFGCSFHLLSIFWSRLALYFLAQAQTRDNSNTTQSTVMDEHEDEDVEETSFIGPSAPVAHFPVYKSVFSPGPQNASSYNPASSDMELV